MLKINIKDLKFYTEELNKLVEKYEENSMLIAKKMQDAELLWHDDNSQDFFTNITKQKSELKEFISSIKKLNCSYSEIAKKVDKIKSNIKEIFVDEAQKGSIKNAYNTAINKLKTIKNRLSCLSIYFCTYYEKNIIRTEISKIGNSVSSLENSLNDIENMFTKAKELETSINTLMSKITIESISIIDYSRYL